jgi:hypothetical protein
MDDSAKDIGWLEEPEWEFFLEEKEVRGFTEFKTEGLTDGLSEGVSSLIKAGVFEDSSEEKVKSFLERNLACEKEVWLVENELETIVGALMEEFGGEVFTEKHHTDSLVMSSFNKISELEDQRSALNSARKKALYGILGALPFLEMDDRVALIQHCIELKINGINRVKNISFDTLTELPVNGHLDGADLVWLKKEFDLWLKSHGLEEVEGSHLAVALGLIGIVESHDITL